MARGLLDRGVEVARRGLGVLGVPGGVAGAPLGVRRTRWMRLLGLEGGRRRREGGARPGPVAEPERGALPRAQPTGPDEGGGVLAEHRQGGLEQLGGLGRSARLDVGEPEEALPVGEEDRVAQPGGGRDDVGGGALEALVVVAVDEDVAQPEEHGHAGPLGPPVHGQGRAQVRRRHPRGRPRPGPAGCARRGAWRAAPGCRRRRARWRRGGLPRRPGRSAPRASAVSTSPSRRRRSLAGARRSRRPSGPCRAAGSSGMPK